MNKKTRPARLGRRATAAYSDIRED